MSAAGVLRDRLGEGRRWRAFALLVPVYGLGVMFLREPALDPYTLTAFVIDRLLQVGVLAVLAGIPVLLLGPERLAVAAAAASTIIGFGLSASVLGAGLNPPRDVPVLTLALVTLIASLVLARGLWPLLPVVQGERRPAAVLLGALAASTLPLLQLWNASTFTTLRQNVSLSLAPEVASSRGRPTTRRTWYGSRSLPRTGPPSEPS